MRGWADVEPLRWHKGVARSSHAKAELAEKQLGGPCSCTRNFGLTTLGLRRPRLGLGVCLKGQRDVTLRRYQEIAGFVRTGGGVFRKSSLIFSQITRLLPRVLQSVANDRSRSITAPDVLALSPSR